MSHVPLRAQNSSPPADAGSLAEFEALLAYLKDSRGFDFTAYKRSSLMRRVLVRMQPLDVKSFAGYLDLLQVDTGEFTRLFNTILINVTGFFRDPSHWDYLRDEVVPRLVGTPGATDPVRVWSAGCASGEEAYSIAILLAEALGQEAFRERVKIYATDLDEEALSQARHAVYGAQTVQDVPHSLLEKYFQRQYDGWACSKELRRSVIFGRHDLLQDAPISRVDLLICRNCIMYLNTEAQARVLAKFHFALMPRGVLFLGKAESLLAQGQRFEPLDVKRRLFMKADRRPEGRHLTLATATAYERMRQLCDAASDVVSTAQLVVDREGIVVHINQPLRALLGLTARDIGRPLKDLEVSYRPFELRSAIERAYAERRPVSGMEAQWTAPSGVVTYLELSVVPLVDTAGALLGASIQFLDVTPQRRLQDEILRTSQELATALEELQSSNEELETMNEELQSTNAELHAINEEARQRGDQLAELNAFLESILSSLRGAVAVVDRDLHVRKWSRRAEDLWGLRADEAMRKNLLSLEIGLPVDRLHAPIRACLSGESDLVRLTLDATNGRGRPIQVRVTCTPFGPARPNDSRGAILLMEETDGRV